MKTIYSFFIKNFSKKKNHIIYIDDKKYTYSQICTECDLLEKNLNKNNIDFVFYYSLDLYKFLIFYLVCSKLSITFVPLDISLPFDDLINQINLKKVSLIVSEKKKIKLLKSKIKSNFYDKDLNIFFGKKKSYVKKSDIFLLVFTSGSTGKPKPIALTQKNKIDRAISNAKLFKLKKNKKVLITTPLYHSLAIRLLNIGLIYGSEIHIFSKYNEQKILKSILKHELHFTIFVSSQINSILNNLNNFKYLKSLVCIISSSDKLSKINIDKLLDHYSGNIYECYGLSEAGILTLNKIKKNSPFKYSVGKKIPGVKIKILNKKKDKNGNGEILFKSKFIFKNYFKNPTYTNRRFLNGWFKTGDLGFLKKGNLFFSGRKKNMIKIKGISVYPEDIENKIKYNLPIKDVVIFDSLDIRNEKNLHVVCSKENKINKNTLINFCIKNFSNHQIPRYYHFLDQVPKNKLGKIDRKLVKQKIIL